MNKWLYGFWWAAYLAVIVTIYVVSAQTHFVWGFIVGMALSGLGVMYGVLWRRRHPRQ